MTTTFGASYFLPGVISPCFLIVIAVPILIMVVIALACHASIVCARVRVQVDNTEQET